MAPAPESLGLRATKVTAEGITMKGKPTILVVDNEATFCTAMGDTLCSNGYKIKTVDNRADARRAIAAMSPDLVILGCIAPRGGCNAL